ncbi:hypothetical protein IFM89_038176 [Coptis chinensis]|uniref:Bet v I/Major latex protein domain-containing protein n=1 Tax=Coptis chinensis TaxID=261450 RepID=A0A835I8V6_9MAGN|nr:hypothetical protein IFM89_038176 [Coptis chinensis]
MSKEEKAELMVRVGIQVLWKAFVQDMTTILPKVVPNMVKDIQLLEGDGGLGTIMLFNFGSDVKNVTYQKEKIVEFDEAHHKIAIQVLGGGHLDLGFSSYKTAFHFTEIGDTETQVDISVLYDTKLEKATMALETTRSALAVIECFEKYLLHNDA